MKVLLIEDDEEWASMFASEVKSRCDAASVTNATSRESGLRLLEKEDYSLIVLDLEIPAADNDIKISREFGITAMLSLKGLSPGTPIIFHSAYGDSSLKMLKDALANSEPRDLFGSGEKFPMLQCIDKTDVLTCLEIIKEMHNQEKRLKDSVEVWCTDSGTTLQDAEKRIIKVFARRREANKVKVTPLSGGKSSARVYALELFEQDGRCAIHAVSKIASNTSIADERRRYHLLTSLDIGAHAQFLDEVDAGSGKLFGVFYRLADSCLSLFQVLGENAAEISKVIQAIETIEKPWREGAPIKKITIGELRKSFIEDSKLRDLAIVFDWDLDAFENTEVEVRWCPQHRDLHGENVLVNSQMNPVLIDYGMTEKSSSCIDAIQLELSLITQEAGRKLCNGWPNQEQALNWAELEKYLIDCPIPTFVRSCREWMYRDSAAGRKGQLASAYAYTMRQLKYEGIDHSVILNILKSIIEAIKLL